MASESDIAETTPEGVPGLQLPSPYRPMLTRRPACSLVSGATPTGNRRPHRDHVEVALSQIAGSRTARSVRSICTRALDDVST
jgi:hypothetical protein